jgi:hypothetical protein
MLLILTPFHPPIAKLITQTTDDKIVNAKENLTLKNDLYIAYLPCAALMVITFFINPPNDQTTKSK